LLPSYVIRRADLADISIIQRIARDTWPKAYGEILSSAQIAYMLDLMYSTETLSAQMSTSATADQQQFLLLRASNETENAWCGFAAFQTNASGLGVSKLHKLYCLPSVQGRGVGAALVHEVTRLCLLEEQHALILNVNKYNQAKRFYEKLGFRVLREEVIDIGRGYVMDDYVLGLELTAAC
jgi:diamine N-acetyltransferase